MKNSKVGILVGGFVLSAALLASSNEASAAGTSGYVYPGQAVNFSDPDLPAGRYLVAWAWVTSNATNLQVYSANAGFYTRWMAVQCNNGNVVQQTKYLNGPKPTVALTCLSSGIAQAGAATLDDNNNM